MFSDQHISVGMFPLPIVTTGSGTICNGSSISITAGGASTYTWSNSLGTGTPKIVNPTITTTYNVTGTDANGCTNSASAVVTVNSLPTVTATGGTVCINANNITLTASGANTYLWSNGLGTGVTKPVTPTTSTTYTVTGTNSSGCSNTANAIIIVRPKPYPTIKVWSEDILTGNIIKDYYCKGGWLDISISGGNYTYQSQTVGNTEVLTFYSTNMYGCWDTTIRYLPIDPLPNITVNNATICQGSSVTLTANGAKIYQWTDTHSNILSTGKIYTVNPTSNTYFDVIGIDSIGCSNSAQAMVTVNALPTITSNLPTTTVCSGQQVSLNGSGAISYTWNNGISNNIPFTPLPGITTYTVTGSDVNNCTNTAQSIVTVNPLPTVIAGGGSNCFGSSINITVNGANTYTWSNSLGSGNTKTVSPTTSTTYTVTGTDANGCSNTANAIVTVNSNPIAYAGKKQITCPGVSLTLNATGGETYSWSSGSTSASATVTPTITSTYTVTVSNASNCSASSSVVVVVATTLYSNNTGSWNTDNDWDFTVAPAPCNDVVINYGNTVDLTNISGRCNNLTVLGTLNIDGTSTLTCSGKVFNGSTGIINLVGGISGAYYDFTTPGNTVVYSNTSSDQSVIPVKYHHLTIQNFGYTATMISNDNDTVNGNLMINGTLQSTSQNLFIGGNFINNGNFIHNNGKVTFNGNTLYTGSSITTFNNVDVAPGKLLTIDGNGKTMKVLKNIYIKATDAHNIGQLAIADNSSKLIGAGETDSVFVQIYDTLNNWHYQAAPLYNGYMGAMALRYYYGKSFNEITNTYVAVTGYDSLQAGKGYTIRFNPTLLSEFKRLTTFSGPISKLHTGTITLPVTNTVGKGDGWNLVGNPYPSAIDWEAANGWHNTNIDPTVYVYDSYHHSYATYNSNTHTGTNGGTRYIPSMQGFYVHCAANGLWSMDNRVRIAYNQPFWKGEEISTSDFSNQVRLLINGNNFSDETMIAFGNEATNGFDDMLDAYKLFSPEENVPQINSKTLENNSVKVAVNNLPVSKMYNSIVPVEITTGVGGKYTITAKNLTIDPTVDVTLEDLKTKTFTDLRSSSYIFTTDVVSNENRFNVLFGARPTTIKEINTENISIYANHSQIVIKNYSGSTEKSLVTVYDILGKQITEKNIEPNTTSIIDINSSIAQSICFVKVVTENKTLTKKICITR